MTEKPSLNIEKLKVEGRVRLYSQNSYERQIVNILHSLMVSEVIYPEQEFEELKTPFFQKIFKACSEKGVEEAILSIWLSKAEEGRYVPLETFMQKLSKKLESAYQKSLELSSKESFILSSGKNLHEEKLIIKNKDGRIIDVNECDEYEVLSLIQSLRKKIALWEKGTSNQSIKVLLEELNRAIIYYKKRFLAISVASDQTPPLEEKIIIEPADSTRKTIVSSNPIAEITKTIDPPREESNPKAEAETALIETIEEKTSPLELDLSNLEPEGEIDLTEIVTEEKPSVPSVTPEPPTKTPEPVETPVPVSEKKESLLERLRRQKAEEEARKTLIDLPKEVDTVTSCVEPAQPISLLERLKKQRDAEKTVVEKPIPVPPPLPKKEENKDPVPDFSDITEDEIDLSEISLAKDRGTEEITQVIRIKPTRTSEIPVSDDLILSLNTILPSEPTD